jgi:hypothetical protein
MLLSTFPNFPMQRTARGDERLALRPPISYQRRRDCEHVVLAFEE